MSIGYACHTLAVSGAEIKKCLLRNADEATLRGLIEWNLNALERMVDYNLQNGIRLYRISSDLIPFASSPVNHIPWALDYADRLAAIGRKILQGGMRVSMHPGQYTVLNSPNPTVAENAVRELAYHTLLLDALGVPASHRIILHVGGAYGDKSAALARFRERFAALPQPVRARLTVENDDRIFTAEDALAVGRENRIPVVFDNLHHRLHPSGPPERDDASWIRLCAETWSRVNGCQKIHYSQPDPEKKPGAHSTSIRLDGFLPFYRSLSDPLPDIMLEVKDKNLSALKCILATDSTPPPAALEREWARYKYRVLEHSQRHYRQIRELLKRRAPGTALSFYRHVEEALALPIVPGEAINAAEHVWGYFRGAASPSEKTGFQKALASYAAGELSLSAVKRRLQMLAEAHKESYLTESYYFLL